MKKPLILIFAALLTSMINVQAAQSDASQTSTRNVNNNDPKCPDVVLRRELPESQRYDAAMFDDDPIYLSKHYCFGFWEIEGMTKYDFPTKYTFKQAGCLVAIAEPMTP
ncbi:MAG: hypothetical protein HRT35_28525 [Algicola sp.]|nr:hypothetical protein [Algicola sp.]